MGWSEAVSSVRAEIPRMPQATWKAFCQLIVNQKGYVMAQERPRLERRYRCGLCGMEWATAMELEGKPHKAILNHCGGVWSLKAEPEEYEIEE